MSKEYWGFHFSTQSPISPIVQGMKMYLNLGALQTSFFTVPQEVLEKAERFALRHFRKERTKGTSLKRKKHIQHVIFLRRNLLILINSSSEIAECHNHFKNTEKGCGWLLGRSQTKKTKLGSDLGNAYFVLVLSHKTTHTHKGFSFPFGILGTHCCAFGSVQFPNLG